MSPISDPSSWEHVPIVRCKDGRINRRNGTHRWHQLLKNAFRSVADECANEWLRHQILIGRETYIPSWHIHHVIPLSTLVSQFTHIKQIPPAVEKVLHPMIQEYERLKHKPMVSENLASIIERLRMVIDDTGHFIPIIHYWWRSYLRSHQQLMYCTPEEHERLHRLLDQQQPQSLYTFFGLDP